MPLRYDYSSIKVTKTDEGFVIDSPIVARTGILEYRNADGSVRKELRLPEDVFHADSLATFVGKPITVNHPTGPVTSSNVKDLMVGIMLSAAKLDDDKVQASIIIHEPDKIGVNRELSLGYTVEFDETPGIWNGQKYDAIQRNIKVNHLSIVHRARAGSIARLNVDSDEEYDIPETNPEKENTMPMVKVKLDSGIEYEAPAEVVAAYNKLNNDHIAATSALAAKDKVIADLNKERDTLKTRVDGLPAEIEKAVTEKVKTMKADSDAVAALAETAKSYNVDCAGKTAKEIKIAVLTAHNKDFKADGKSDDFIDGVFAMVPAKKEDPMQQQRVQMNTPDPTKKTDNDDTDPADAWRGGFAGKKA